MDQETTNQIFSIKKEIQEVNKKFKSLEATVSKLATMSELLITEEKLRSSIDNTSNTINNINEKLSMIKLPNDTKYYLDEAEVTVFRNNSQKLSIMIADVEDLYKNMVAYVSSLK